MIADDDEGMQLLMSHTLERAGHEVLRAPDGERGVQLVRDHALRGHAPDLWIFDANMPLVNGPDAIAHLRAEGFSTPAILITAGARDSVSGVDADTRFLPKPFSPPRLLAFVSQVLREVKA